MSACGKLDSKGICTLYTNLLSTMLNRVETLAIQLLQARQARSLFLGPSGSGWISPKNKLLVCRLISGLIKEFISKFIIHLE